jgi:hypothetical protein
MPRRKATPPRSRDLVRRLREFGVVEDVRRGKGSEALLIKPVAPGSKKGPRTTIRRHSEHDMIPVETISAALRRLEIDSDDFWVF